MLAGGAIAHTSRRQRCITLSSCEAELIALCDAAVELIYIIGLVEFIGHKVTGSVEVSTDNKGAYDLCHRYTSAQHSRHVDRKLFKMRELRGASIAKVNLIPTESNPADLFTKILGRSTFEKHRATVMNTAADERKSDKPSSAQTKANVTSAGSAALSVIEQQRLELGLGATSNDVFHEVSRTHRCPPRRFRARGLRSRR